MDVEEFCLRWNNHHNILVSVLDNLLGKESLVDVTLAAEGRILRVHRLVLCACSQYFEDMLCNQIDKQAVVFLKDVKFADLKALVEYMYRGEVNVAQDQLATFLSTAEALKIKGLAYKEENIKGTTTSMKNSSPTVLKPLRNKTSDTPTSSTPPRLPTPQSSQVVESQLVESSTRLQQEHSEAQQDSLHHSSINTNSLDAQLNSVIETDDHFVAVDAKMESDIESNADQDEDQLEGNENEWPVQDGDDEWSNSNTDLITVSVSESPTVLAPGSAVLSQETWSDNSLAGPSGLAAVVSGSTTGIKIKGKIKVKTSAASKAQMRGGGGESDYYHQAKLSNRTVCGRCGRNYSCKSALLRHLRYECGVGPQFQCHVCQAKFKRNERLTYHLRSVHDLDHPLLRRGSTKRGSRLS